MRFGRSRLKAEGGTDNIRKQEQFNRTTPRSLAFEYCECEMGKKGRKQNSIKETVSRTTNAAEEVNALTHESRMRPEAAARTGGLLSETQNTVRHRATRFGFFSDEAAHDPEMQRYVSRMTALSCKDWVDWDNPDVGAVTRCIATECSEEYFHQQLRQLNSLKAIIEQQNRIGDFQKTVGLLDQAMLMTAESFFTPKACHDLYVGLGNAYGHMGMFTESITLHEQQLEKARVAGDTMEQRYALKILGVMHANM